MNRTRGQKYEPMKGGFIQLAIIPAIGAAITAWFTRKIASVVAKVGLSTFQTGLAWAVIGLQIVIGLAIASLIALLFNSIQDLLDYVFGLSSHASPTVQTAVDVTKSIGVWDGTLDALNLVMPFFSGVLVIKLSIVGIRLLKAISTQADRIIKTALSHGF